jgi:hypothetical protein
MISCVLPGEKRVLRDRDSSISSAVFWESGEWVLAFLCWGRGERNCWLFFV